MLDSLDGPGFQTQRTLRAFLSTAGIHPKKRFGQCFLVDRNLMNKLVDSAELEASDCVLEVGCGTGSLTSLLANRCASVVAVEVDAEVAGIARMQLERCANVFLMEIDALRDKHTVAPAVLERIHETREKFGGRLMLVANLPYDIATPLIVNLLIGSAGFSRLCFTVQTEVADRFLAAPGSRDYGPVSVLTQLLTSGRRICRLPPKAFWPAPKVHSTMLRLDVEPVPRLPRDRIQRFSEFVHALFNYRRKTIGHIARMLQIDDRLLPAMQQMNVLSKERPQNLTVEHWVSAFRACDVE